MRETELEVLDPGALSTIQDLGRPGHAHLGVPRSGALDEPALRLANRLVGNPESAAAIETTLSGIRLRARHGCRIAVTGAGAPIRVAGRLTGWGVAVPVRAGTEIEIGAATTGLRSYLAVAGGIEVEQVLGSRSTDLLSGLGPAPLRAGDVLRTGVPAPAYDGAEAVRGPTGTTLHLDLGPRADWFTEESVAALDGAVYTVGAASNRIGLRLVGAELERAREGELPTEPVVLGAVQVPPNGQPVVFLHDHPTTGGYPVIAVVSAADLPVCAQARPGDELTLRVRGRTGAGPGRPPRS